MSQVKILISQFKYFYIINKSILTNIYEIKYLRGFRRDKQKRQPEFSPSFLAVRQNYYFFILKLLFDIVLSHKFVSQFF